MRRIVFKWSSENDRSLALGLDAFLHCFLDHAHGIPSANVLPIFCAMNPWESAEVPLDKRFHRGEVEAAHEEKREVAGICKPIFIERERFVEIPLVDCGDCSHAPAQMILPHDVREGLG